MSNKNSKTSTDLLFENYLTQRKLCFTYEPEPKKYKTKIPDYYFTQGVANIVVECEEIEHLPDDNIPEGVSSFDLNNILKPIKKKLYIASKQIKPYSDRYDYSLVILGKKDGWNIDRKDVYWSMFGNPIIRVPIDPTGKKRYKAAPDMQVKGQFRKNNPRTKQMIFPSKYVSGVAIVKYKNGLEHYKNKLYDKYIGSESNIDLDKSLRITMDFFEKGWKKYNTEIPKKYLEDESKLIYYIEAISNPFSDKPLPRNIFNGRLDSTIIPKVVNNIKSIVYSKEPVV